MGRALALLAILSLATGCGGSINNVSPITCLTGPTPRMGRPEADAWYLVLRDRWDALPSMDPLAQAALLPTLHAWIPDVSDSWPEPSCEDELGKRMTDELLGKRPVPLSRLSFSRAVASQSRELLRRTLALRDDELTGYVHLPEEPPGHEITAAQLRDTVAAIVRWQEHFDHPEQLRAAARAQLAMTADARALYALDFHAHEAIDADVIRGPVLRVSGDTGRSMLKKEIALLRAWIDEPHEGARFELALKWIRRLGRYGPHYLLRPEIKAVLEPLVARRGDVPLARGHTGAADDLWLNAARAMFDLYHPMSPGFASIPMARRSAPAFMTPGSHPDVQRWVAESTPLSPRARAEVLALLDRQLQTSTYPSARCRLLTERVIFSLPDDRVALLIGHLPKATESGPIRFGEMAGCALGLFGKAPALTADAAQRLLMLAKMPAERVEPVQSPPPGGFQLRHVPQADGLSRAASAALLEHAAAAARDPEVFAWLEALAERAPVTEQDAGLKAAEAVFPRWLPAERPRAQAVLRRWMAESIALLRGKPPLSSNEYEYFARTQMMIGRWAPPAGFSAETAKYLTQARALLPSFAAGLDDMLVELAGSLVVCEVMIAPPGTNIELSPPNVR